MNRKIFTFLLLAVFMLAQFGSASAAVMPGTAAITSIPGFGNNVSVSIGWSVTGMAGPNQTILIWGKDSTTPAYLPADCHEISSTVGAGNASGTYVYPFAGVGNGNVWNFTITVDSSAFCAGAAVPLVTNIMGTTTIDSVAPYGFLANPPSSLTFANFYDHTVSCKTFEMWGVASDRIYTDPAPYSGFDSWNTVSTGTSASPAPLGPDNSVLSWVFTLPATSSGLWSFSADPADKLNNKWGTTEFRKNIAVTAAELADCSNFTDTAGHADEVQIRYLADLGLISGNPDGSFSPNNTLTRAEASSLFEKANGKTAAGLPTTPPSAACTFTDVAATDWFAGWVWQACADGFMNGLGGGRFGPSDLLTRGQIVTIFNNIDVKASGAAGSYLDNAGPNTVLNSEWNSWGTGYHLRPANFTDISVGAFYALPVQYAYAVGVADGTSATTFSPDQPVLRGEFAKMLYRAISRVS